MRSLRLDAGLGPGSATCRGERDVDFACCFARPLVNVDSVEGDFSALRCLSDVIPDALPPHLAAVSGQALWSMGSNGIWGRCDRHGVQPRGLCSADAGLGLSAMEDVGTL